MNNYNTAVTTVATTITVKKDCTEDSQCPLNLVCKSGTCSMAPIVPKVLGLDKFTIGMPCSNDSDCTLENSSCNGKLCQCKDGFISSLNLKTCLPKAKSLGDECTEISQCVSLTGSICEKGKCTKIDTKLFSSVGAAASAAAGRLTPLLIGSTCQTNDECDHISNALCLDNVCQCNEHYVTSVLSNACLLKAKKEGDACDIDKQCEDIKGALCNKNKCVKHALAGTKLGNPSRSSTTRISQIVAALVFIKFIFF